MCSWATDVAKKPGWTLGGICRILQRGAQQCQSSEVEFAKICQIRKRSGPISVHLPCIQQCCAVPEKRIAGTVLGSSGPMRKYMHIFLRGKWMKCIIFHHLDPPSTIKNSVLPTSVVLVCILLPCFCWGRGSISVSVSTLVDRLG